MSWTKVAQVQSADVNVLLNATFDTSHHHVAARDWLMRARSDSQGLGLFSSVLVSYLRISTDRRVFDEPLLMADAQRFIEALLASPMSE